MAPAPTLHHRRAVAAGALRRSQRPEIADRPLQSLIEADLRLPAKLVARQADVRAALSGIVLGGRGRADPSGGSGHLKHLRGELADREFFRITEVDRTSEVVRALHQLHQTIDQIVDVAERAGLVAGA